MMLSFAKIPFNGYKWDFKCTLRTYLLMSMSFFQTAAVKVLLALVHQLTYILSCQRSCPVSSIYDSENLSEREEIYRKPL